MNMFNPFGVAIPLPCHNHRLRLRLTPFDPSRGHSLLQNWFYQISEPRQGFKKITSGGNPRHTKSFHPYSPTRQGLKNIAVNYVLTFS
jgi:hypothetical protein